MPIESFSFVPKDLREWANFFKAAVVAPSPDSVTDATFGNRAANSVIGRAGNTTGKPADIVAAADGRFLVRRSSALSFDSLTDTDIPSGIARDTEVAAAIAAALVAYLTSATAASTYVAQAAATLTGTTTITGVISPAQIVADTDNYAPTGLSTASVLRLSTDASRNLTGITGGASGRVLIVLNVGAQDLVLKNDVTSTAANRFKLGADVTLNGDEGITLWYDNTSTRWRAIGKHA